MDKDKTEETFNLFAHGGFLSTTTTYRCAICHDPIYTSKSLAVDHILRRHPEDAARLFKHGKDYTWTGTECVPNEESKTE